MQFWCILGCFQLKNNIFVTQKKKKTDYFDVDNSGKIEQRFVNFSLLTFKTLIKFLCVLILVNFFTTR